MSRVFVVFPTEEERAVAAAVLSVDVEATMPYLGVNDRRLLIADLSDEEVEAARESKCEIFPDFRLEPFPRNLLEYKRDVWRFWEPTRPPISPAVTAPPAWYTKTLKDVLHHIKAPAAWARSKGANVTIVVIDTGVSGHVLEFPLWKRSTHSLCFAYASGPWDDPKGHGSMCACIATATDVAGGRYNGVAPDATLLSARTNLRASDIYRIYDRLITLKKTGEIQGPIVVSNSYGHYACSPPTWPQGHPYRSIVEMAVRDHKIVVVFAAGNNHYDVLCNNPPDACSPNTIWGVNSIDDVITVGTVDWDNNNRSPGAHANSSRGPGQWSDGQEKPDCVAPTYGEVMWGNGYRKMEWWGTSGACPQVAGLAALLLSLRPELTPQQVKNIIKQSAVKLHTDVMCVGAGIIDCEAAVTAVG